MEEHSLWLFFPLSVVDHYTTIIWRGKEMEGFYFIYYWLFRSGRGVWCVQEVGGCLHLEWKADSICHGSDFMLRSADSEWHCCELQSSCEYDE